MKKPPMPDAWLNNISMINPQGTQNENQSPNKSDLFLSPIKEKDREWQVDDSKLIISDAIAGIKDAVSNLNDISDFNQGNFEIMDNGSTFADLAIEQTSIIEANPP